MKTRYSISLVGLTALTMFAMSSSACSSSTSSGSASTTQDPGATGAGDTAAASAPDTNPAGVPYPTTNLGTAPRSGSTPGNTMYNYKFVGYPDGKIENGLQAMSLADFYDPTGAKYKMIRIQASGSWCVHCQAETKVAATLPTELASRQVAYIISLAEGPVPGTPSTDSDLQTWIMTYQAPYTHFLDPGNRNFGPFYNAAALPWNATLDAKTMEIMDSEVGGLETTTDFLADIDKWLAQL